MTGKNYQLKESIAISRNAPNEDLLMDLTNDTISNNNNNNINNNIPFLGISDPNTEENTNSVPNSTKKQQLFTFDFDFNK